MKTIRKLLLITIALFAMFGTVHAEENEVIYNGKDIVSNDDTADSLHDAVNGLEPGTTSEFTVKFTNGTDEDSHWYIENEMINSLEDSKDTAKNGGYTYKLEYINPKGETKVLFDSNKVGGEEETSPVTGLKQATQATKDQYFYIDTLKGKESGYIRITISLDGESQPNSYMDTKGNFEIRFAVLNDVPVPDTGDNSKLSIYTGIFAGSVILAAACLGYVIYLNKKKEAR